MTEQKPQTTEELYAYFGTWISTMFPKGKDWQREAVTNKLVELVVMNRNIRGRFKKQAERIKELEGAIAEHSDELRDDEIALRDVTEERDSLRLVLKQRGEMINELEAKLKERTAAAKTLKDALHEESEASALLKDRLQACDMALDAAEKRARVPYFIGEALKSGEDESLPVSETDGNAIRPYPGPLPGNGRDVIGILERLGLNGDASIIREWSIAEVYGLDGYEVRVTYVVPRTIPV